ncbi:MAG TPA: SpoIIE family protein phosphatase [Vicinamibacteria bacterium]|nr:SpoIIE family protein phosphatase [Vicinamibacteria bacterium]
MQPLLPEGPRPPALGLRARVGTFFTATWPGRVVAVALAVWLLDGLVSLVGRALPGAIGGPARVVLSLFAVWLAWRGFRWVSDRLLWRIRTKLIVSYLFIALVPVVLLSLFMGVAILLLLGLTASRVVTGEIDRSADVLQATARSALAGLPAGEADAAAALPARLAAAREAHPTLSFSLLRVGRVVASSGDAPRALPPWWKGPGFAGLVRLHPKEKLSAEALRAVWAEGGAALVVEVPADEAFYADLERRTGIHVFQRSEMQVEPADRDRAKVRLGRGSEVAYEEGGQRVSAPARSGFMFVALPEKTNWETGEKSAFDGMPVAFQYEPRALVRRLSPIQLPRDASGRSVPDLLLYVMGILALVFVVVYAVALVLGLVLARSITRGVHALSVGTQKLRQGDFDHQIRIRSRDQLGELAESFNLMSRGIRQLMLEQGEKERLEEELRIARQIQMSLLPAQGVAGLPGVRVAALCLPAAEVGGDYYDLLPLGETRMGVLVADVSGKGTSAALYMAELKGLVLSLSRIYLSPAKLLSEANRILAAHMDSRSFVTMTYAVVDTAARRMRYARAGHNPLIHFQARTGLTRVLTPAGLGLGLDPGDRFDQILEEDEVALDPGDFFLFFTDGLSEAMNAGAELFGEGRLRRILEDSSRLTSEELKERILEEVRRFVGDADPHDDMTLVVLKIVPEEGPA